MDRGGTGLDKDGQTVSTRLIGGALEEPGLGA